MNDIRMLDTLMVLLSVDSPAPEILVEEDGDLLLTYPGNMDISINPNGKVNWAITSPRKHGTDLNEFIKQLSFLS